MFTDKLYLRATLATSGSASSNPSSVQQPGISLVVLNLVGQHLSISHWVQSQERLSEAR